VLSYSFAQDPGATVRDLSEGRHDGAIVNGVFVPAAVGAPASIRLNGKDAYIDCGDLSSLGLSGDATFELRARENGPIKVPWGLVFGQMPAVNFHLSIAYEHSLVFLYEVQRGETLLEAAPRNLLTSEWTHLAVVVQYPRCRFYRNGLLVRDCYMAAPGLTGAETGHLCIGGGPGDNGRHLPIDVAEFRVYRRALSGAEVAADAAGKTGEFIASAELTSEPDWYAGSVRFRLSAKQADVPSSQAQFEFIPVGAERSRLMTARWAESAAGSGRYVATVTLPIAEVRDRALIVRAWREGEVGKATRSLA